MSEQISIGDLVMVVRECCHVDSCLGEVYIVLDITTGSDCTECGAADDLPAAILEAETEDFYGFGLPLSYLKKIPPLGELRDLKRDEKLTEPA